MKILFCNYEYPPLGGGGGVLNAHLAAELAQRHNVTVLTSRALGSPEREIVDGVEIIRVNVMGRSQAAAANMLSMLSYLPMGALKGRGLMKERPFDVINTHFVVPTGPVGAYLSRRTGTPNVLTVHGGDLYDPSKASSPHRHMILRMLIRRLLRAADVVVGQSQNTVENVHKYYDSDVDCELIPLGIRRVPEATANRAQLGFSDDEKILVTVGRLVARKAVDQLIRVMGKIKSEKVRLVIIGDGPLRVELENVAKETGVADRVIFAGFASDEEKRNLLAAADLYVSTSQHEGFGLVFLEGMAASLPVICYDFGGQTDFLDDQITGSLVPLNDEKAFVSACEYFLDSSAVRSTAGKENLRRVESFYIDNCARQYESLFEATIQQSTRS